MFKRLITFAILFSSASCFGIDVELFINKGEITISGHTFHHCCFSESPDGLEKNKNIRLDVGESLNLTITNNDSLAHDFTINGVIESNNLISAGGVLELSLTFDAPGTNRYYSSFSYGELSGAAGNILVGWPEYEAFYWNLFDLNKNHSLLYASAIETELIADYQPELFLINGTFFPNTVNDSETLVSTTLGDSVIISLTNNGRMDHVLHFHGFHVTILSSNLHPERINWSKDTFPVKSGESMTVLLHTDQVGTYPVHDHNLIAVTNAGFYPGGMLTQIQVSQ